MKKYLGVITGSVVTLAGILGLVRWRADFLTMLKGSIPLLLIFCGVIAVIAGISSLTDEAALKKDSNR